MVDNLIAGRRPPALCSLVHPAKMVSSMSQHVAHHVMCIMVQRGNGMRFLRGQQSHTVKQLERDNGHDVEHDDVARQDADGCGSPPPGCSNREVSLNPSGQEHKSRYWCLTTVSKDAKLLRGLPRGVKARDRDEGLPQAFAWKVALRCSAHGPALVANLLRSLL
jgi:hypothetical protein